MENFQHGNKITMQFKNFHVLHSALLWSLFEKFLTSRAVLVSLDQLFSCCVAFKVPVHWSPSKISNTMSAVKKVRSVLIRCINCYLLKKWFKNFLLNVSIRVEYGVAIFWKVELRANKDLLVGLDVSMVVVRMISALYAPAHQQGEKYREWLWTITNV